MPSRRDWLRQCSQGAAGSLLAGLARAEAAAPAVSRARSVILIFNCGAPSHLDLWDMKPEAPSNIRGEFRPIDTAVPGIQVSELMPNVVRHADKLAIVRTVHHAQAQHNSGMYWSIVGQPYRVDSTLINPSRADYPSFGTLVGWLARRDGYAGALPPYVITPGPHCDSLQYITPGQFGSCLGAAYDPFVVNSDPNANNFQVSGMGPCEGVSPGRVDERRSLLTQFSRHNALAPTPLADEFGLHRERALSLMTDAASSRAFDLSDESPETRERYGRHTWGQSHLLARRLVEAGVRFVTTVNGQSIVWDTHTDNFNLMKNRLVPPMERAYGALLDDLEERGLLDTTLVIWMADFGRTPVINGNAGRDHWPQCYSVVLAGCGIRGGQTVGESDKHGAAPLSRPVTPADVHATVFAALGYDSHAITYLQTDGRPTLLSEGAAIGEVL
ncbi:MAG: DUF1501 domain-containing protein [Planctomyces sp.]|nr:DUF1501 domain-containing protein [Planctomyces sp.]